MENYDLIVIGTGSAMNYINPIINSNPKIKIAVIDKDEPGGICLTRGCIPSKILLYPAELIRELETAPLFGIKLEIKDIDFNAIMERMRRKIGEDIEMIREGLAENPYLDYYHESAEFISPYTLKVGEKTLYSKMIFLCTGSRPAIPPVKGLEEAGYLTSDTVLELTECPEQPRHPRRELHCSRIRAIFLGYGSRSHGYREKFPVSSAGRARNLKTCQDENVGIHEGHHEP